MDALALLCNLYGDGPATLKRLRSAGCDSFGALDDLEPDQLAPILGTNEAAARRFLREARLLVERLAEGELEQEERPPLPAGPTPAARAPEPAVVPAAADADGDGVDARSSEVIDRVLATWRERDQVRVHEPRRAQAEAAPEEDEALEGDFEEDDLEEDELQGGEPQASEPEGTPLVPRLVDGLDRAQCEALERAGFGTLEELADADALVVSRQAALELTRVMRLQFLVRRQLAERGPVDGPEPAFSLAGPTGELAPETGSARAQVLRPLRPSPAPEEPRPWPLARGQEPGAPLPAREPRRGSAGASPLDRVPLAGEAGARLADRPRSEAELEEGKFSISEAPFGAATSRLADELDRAARLLQREDARRTGPSEGTGGPFA